MCELGIPFLNGTSLETTRTGPFSANVNVKPSQSKKSNFQLMQTRTPDPLVKVNST